MALLVILLAVACGDSDTPTSQPGLRETHTAVEGTPGPLTWSQKAPLPTPRSEVASAVLDGKIYVIAGFRATGGSSDVVEVYDVTSDRWERRAALPEARDHAMAAAFSGKVYVFGGGLGDATRSVFAYDPARDAWSRMADMPHRRTAGGAAVLGDRIIVAGGTGDSPTDTMIYDPAANRWSAGPLLLEPREHLGVTAAGGKVYVVGGRWNDVLKANNEALDSLTGSWQRLAPMPTARGGTSAGEVNGRVFVAGGEAFGPSRTFPEVEVFDPVTGTWAKAPNLPTPRHGLAVAGLGHVLYVIGGGPEAGLSVDPHNEALQTR